MFPGNVASRDTFSRGTWCKPRDYFGPTTVLGRSIHILCCCIMTDDTNMLHLFRDITNIDCYPRSTFKIMSRSVQCCPLSFGPWATLHKICGIIFQCCSRHQSTFVYCTTLNAKIP